MRKLYKIHFFFIGPRGGGIVRSIYEEHRERQVRLSLTAVQARSQWLLTFLTKRAHYLQTALSPMGCRKLAFLRRPASVLLANFWKTCFNKSLAFTFTLCNNIANVKGSRLREMLFTVLLVPATQDLSNVFRQGLGPTARITCFPFRLAHH